MSEGMTVIIVCVSTMADTCHSLHTQAREEAAAGARGGRKRGGHAAFRIPGQRAPRRDAQVGIFRDGLGGNRAYRGVCACVCLCARIHLQI